MDEGTDGVFGSAVFWELHRGLPRQGPGDDQHTRRAFHALEARPDHPLPINPVVVDLGSGPGMQTLELARLLESRVIAIDNHEPFLEELKERARREGLEELVETRVGEMRDPGFEAGSVDLFWSEGAIYIVGFERGLAAWRPLLSSRGAIAVTEAAWLKPGAPEELSLFWREAYPAMTGREENARLAEGCGYRVLDHFALPAEAWWTHYYTPLEKRLVDFRQRYAGDPDALAVLNEEAREIELFRRYHEYYGYVFYVLEVS